MDCRQDILLAGLKAVSLGFWSSGNAPTQKVHSLEQEQVILTLKSLYLVSDKVVAAASFYYESGKTRVAAHELESLFASGDVMFFLDENIEDFDEHGRRKVEKSPKGLHAYADLEQVRLLGKRLKRLSGVLRRPGLSISDRIVELWIQDIYSQSEGSLGNLLAAEMMDSARLPEVQQQLASLATSRKKDFVWEYVGPALTRLHLPPLVRRACRRRLTQMYSLATADLMHAEIDRPEHSLQTARIGSYSHCDVALFLSCMEILGVRDALKRLPGADLVKLKHSSEFEVFRGFYSQLIDIMAGNQTQIHIVLPLYRDAIKHAPETGTEAANGITREQFLNLFDRTCTKLIKKRKKFRLPLETLLDAYRLFSGSPIERVIDLFHTLEPQKTATPSQKSEPTVDTLPAFASESALAVYLRDWTKNHWKRRKAGGTGRSGNEVVPALWRNKPALLKISVDGLKLSREAQHLDALAAHRAGIPVTRVLARAVAEDEDDHWMAYLMQPVGQMSLRDYLFQPAPKLCRVLEKMAASFESLYTTSARSGQSSRRVGEYLGEIASSLEKLSGYASFSELVPCLHDKLIINQEQIPGPRRLVKMLSDRWNGGDPALTSVEPAHCCHVHGDLHFENIRVNPSEMDSGSYWIIDPKDFAEHDYIYDIAKLVTSLTGHAHADIGESERGNPEMVWTQCRAGKIAFDCFLSARQLKAWREALHIIEAMAIRVASRLEFVSAAKTQVMIAERKMKQRLLLGLARHFLSAARYFYRPEAQYLLFSRGAQFLDLFAKSVNGEPRPKWDPFEAGRSDSWLKTR